MRPAPRALTGLALAPAQALGVKPKAPKPVGQAQLDKQDMQKLLHGADSGALWRCCGVCAACLTCASACAPLQGVTGTRMMRWPRRQQRLTVCAGWATTPA